MQPISLREMLARNTLFADLHDEELDALVARMSLMEVRARDAVFLQGDAGDRFYAVLRGVLKVVASNEEGQETVLSLLDAGTTFGEIALLDGKCRSATVICSSRAELAYIDRQGFLAFLAQHPAVRDKLMVALCQRIRTLTERVEHLSVLDVPARLSRTLLFLASAHGTELQGRHYLQLRVSQGELGGMVGATRESVNKLLRSWDEAGLIAVVDGRIQILKPEDLQRLGMTGA